MNRIFAAKTGLIIAGSLFIGSFSWASDEQNNPQIDALVNDTITALMAEHRIPGMAVALSVDGKRYYFNYGVADQAANTPVTADTLFELGSVSKTFTTALGAYAQASGALSLNDSASQYLLALEGSVFDDVSLVELATYTAGGLPLQFPDDVQDEDEMLDYYRHWQPDYPPGTHRQYSNPSIGLFGYLTAQRLGEPYAALMEEHVFSPLGLEHSYLEVPEEQQPHYAYGYSKDDEAVRVNPGVLDAQAYGVKTNTADMLTFIEAHMDSSTLDETLREALETTQMGYFSMGDMTQALGWERYAYPVTLDQLRAGNSLEMALEANEARRLQPPLPATQDVWFNKTGSTGGFGAYVAFVPSQQMGIVMLANRNYPNQARIEAAYHILTALMDTP
ncbi:class C beta-lactamase [Halomonas sp. AOP43-A1-21]|uniref:class C beta-lactamase n=1 Tax=Halomonas sp. TaxID=1486246 RepID=UPI003A8E93F3